MPHHDLIALFAMTILIFPVILSANPNNSHDLFKLHVQGIFGYFSLNVKACLPEEVLSDL